VNGKCFDTANDPSCCGATGTTCPAPPSGDVQCISGTCVPLCESGMILCNGACVDLQTDLANCGGCGLTCSGVCVGGVCDPTAKEVIATGLVVITMLADGTSVFWNDNATQIRQVDGAGTTAPITLASGYAQVLSMALDSTSVYWSDYAGGGVWRATKGTPGATLVANVYKPRFVAVNSSYIYYDANQGAIYRVAKGGGTPQLFLSAGQYPQIASLAVDDSYVWLGLRDPYPYPILSLVGLDPNTLEGVYFPNSGGTFQQMGVVLGSGNVLWCHQNNCNTLVEATTSPAGPNLGPASPVAVDAAYAYVVANDFVRSGICGGPAEIMAPAGAAAVDDSWLYWVDANAMIHRRAK
jgi:hypothetical protein